MFSYSKIIIVFGIAFLSQGAVIAAQLDDLSKLEATLGVRHQASSPDDCRRAEKMC
jgi:hypothetical protein